jgi:hypothetical protein
MKGYTYIYNMKKYRIKQINNYLFIPQVSKGIFDSLFGIFSGIEIADNTTTWYIKEYQDRYCVTDSLEKAKEVIEKYKNRYNSEKGYPKYHKV